MECHEPANLPIAPLGIDELTMQLGLGRSIYTDKQMKEFYAFQNAAGARNAFLADQTERAYQTRSGGDWGLSLGDKAKDIMLDHMGWSFIPLYRLFGTLSMLFILVIFVVGLVRLVATLLIRTVIITKKKGCGVWVLAAVWGTLYQLIITPIRWADSTAGAENESGGGRAIPVSPTSDCESQGRSQAHLQESARAIPKGPVSIRSQGSRGPGRGLKNQDKKKLTGTS